MNKKKYSGGFELYEDKLRRVMERMGVEHYNYDWNRSGCFIEFTYCNQLYRFEHSLEKAKLRDLKLVYVSDLFAQLVITLEDIARMSERGIYELSSWIEGMKALPPQQDIPPCFIALGFNYIPSMDELKKAYKELVKISHPDCGGNSEIFKRYKSAYDEAKQILKEAAQSGETD